MDGDEFESDRVLGAIDNDINLIDRHEEKKRLQKEKKEPDPAEPVTEPPPADPPGAFFRFSSVL
jgi:hypothetical protein